MRNTMNKYSLLILLLIVSTLGFAQNSDSKVIESKRVRIEIKNVNGQLDTTMVEDIIITDGNEDSTKIIRIEKMVEVDDLEIKSPEKPKLVETSMWVMDWGINAWVSDNSLDLPAEYSDMELENISANFHLGIIQQGINLYKGKVRLVYGFGIEFNNYRLKQDVTITPDVSPFEYEIDDDVNYSKNKIVSRYATVPLMINFKSDPNDDDKSLKIAAGIQAGYLIGSHQKQKWEQGNKKEKRKAKGDYGFEDYRLGYVAQFGYGDFVIYGKYYPTNTFKQNRGPQVNTASVGIVISPF